MRRVLATLVATVAFATMALASDSGYTRKDGYWWRDGLPYDKYTYYYPTQSYSSYSYGGRYYRLEHEYVRAYPPPAPVKAVASVELPKPTDPKWMDKTMDIVEFRQKAIAAQTLRRLEHNSYMEVMNYLGAGGALKGTLEPEAAAQSYGAAAAPPGNFLLGPHGAMGNTLYGYTDTRAEIFGSQVDRNILYQQVARMIQNSQQLAGQGQTDFVDLVKQEGASAANVVEILAKYKLHKAQLESLRAEPKTTIQSREFQFGPQATVQQTVVQPIMPQKAGGPLRMTPNEFRALGQMYCGKCHSGNNPKAGFNVDDYPTFDMATKTRIWNERIFTQDRTKVMPPASEGALPDEVKRQLLLH